MATVAEQHAKELVAQFAARGASPDRSGCTKGNIWLNVCRNKVADGLLARIDDPNLINQNHTNICGVATFVRDWAADNPAGYAELGISLFEAGWGRLGKGNMMGKVVRPTDELKKATIPYFDLHNGRGLEMNHADWIVLGSVREAFNILGYNPSSEFEPLAGMTTPGEVVSMFKAAGYTQVIDRTNFMANQGYDNILEASAKQANGWRVAMLINANMLHDSKIDTRATIGDHWVGLNTTIEIEVVGKDYFVKPFIIFTWGTSRLVPENLNNIPLTTFYKNYFGFVAAKY